MENKRRSRQNSTVRWGDKNAFVLALPPDVAAQAVVEAASRRGLLISRQQVHNIRSLARKAARAEFGRLKPATRADERRKNEAEFKKLARILGYQMSNALVEEVALAVKVMGSEA